MKKLRNLIAVMALASMATVFTGCGDDDDGDDNGGGTPQPQNFAPATEADLTDSDKTYTVNVAGQNPITLTFPSAGNYQMVQDGVTEIGTFSGAAKTGESWQLNISPGPDQAGAQEGVLRLDWTGANAGTWTFTPTGGTAETGTFSVTEIPDDPGNPGNTNNTNPPIGGLVGKTLQINYAGGGGDKFQFTSETAVSWENGTSTGTYTSNTTNDNIDVVLADGQIFDITLSGGTTANVIYQANAGAEQQTFSGNYTLQ